MLCEVSQLLVLLLCELGDGQVGLKSTAKTGRLDPLTSIYVKLTVSSRGRDG